MLVLDPTAITRGDGSPSGAIPGTRLAVPTSMLTTRYEVRGLLLNERNNIDCYWINSMVGLSDATVRDNREVNTDRDGEQFLGGLYSGKPITMKGFIRASTLEKMLDMQMAIEEAFDDITAEFALVGRTGNFNRDWVIYVAKTGTLEISDEQASMDFRRPFMIPLQASKPATFSMRSYSASTLLSAGSSITVTNTGNKRGNFVLTLAGQQQDVRISNSVTRQSFKLNGLIPAGRVWTVNFDTAEIYDDLGVNHFDAYDHTSDWLFMEKNTSQQLAITSTNRDANASVSAAWQMTYK